MCKGGTVCNRESIECNGEGSVCNGDGPYSFDTGVTSSTTLKSHISMESSQLNGSREQI